MWAGRGAARTGPAGSLRADQHLRHRPGRLLRAGAVPPASISSRGRGGRVPNRARCLSTRLGGLAPSVPLLVVLASCMLVLCEGHTAARHSWQTSRGGPRGLTPRPSADGSSQVLAARAAGNQTGQRRLIPLATCCGGAGGCCTAVCADGSSLQPGTPRGRTHGRHSGRQLVRRVGRDATPHSSGTSCRVV